MPQKKRNPFFYFMLDFKNSENSRGMGYDSLADVQEAAGEAWKKMGPKERAPYNERAKESRCQKDKVPEKYTSQGIPLSFIERKKEQEFSSQRSMKKYINDLCKKDLDKEKFYFIYVNYFVAMNTVDYIPAEIAISEFTLKNGITDKFHSYIKVDELPLGTCYRAQTHSNETHKLPYPPNAMGEDNFGALFQAIYDFFTNNEKNDTIPEMFTLEENIPVVESALMQLSSQNPKFEDMAFNIYPLHVLFYNLKLTTCKLGGLKLPESIHITTAILLQDKYEDAINIACKYHEDKERQKYCALSKVIRWGYMFADNLCNDLAIDIKPGIHVPEDMYVPTFNKSRETTSNLWGESSFKNENTESTYSQYRKTNFAKEEYNDAMN